MKKILALVPSVREQECDHSCGYHYTGEIPCTGRLACFMCGSTKPEGDGGRIEDHGDGEELMSYQTKAECDAEEIRERGAAEVREGMRDAVAKLQAETAMLRKALEKLAEIVDCHQCPFGAQGSPQCAVAVQTTKDDASCAKSLSEWAISEARKEAGNGDQADRLQQ